MLSTYHILVTHAAAALYLSPQFTIYLMSNAFFFFNNTGLYGVEINICFNKFRNESRSNRLSETTEDKPTT